MERTIDLSKFDAQFYLPYGRAMANWAYVENSMANWFLRLSGIKPGPGFAVFYSAKSFQGRCEMVRALIPFARTIPAGKRFMTATLNLATNYAQFRNRLAHDAHTMEIVNTEDAVTAERWISSHKGSPPISKGALEIAAANFGFLSSAMMFSMMGGRRLLLEPELSEALLALLPSDPAARQIDLKAANDLIGELLQHQPSA